MFEGKDVKVVLANAGSGKGNWVECIIPTPKGNIRFGDIKEGDYVFDRYGFPTKVLKVFRRGLLDAYRVTLSDGRSTIVSLDHLWNVYRGSYGRKEETLELGTMLSEGIRIPDKRPNRVAGNARFYIPAHLPRHYEAQNVPVDPYVFGVFVGNGCLTEKCLTLSSADRETVDKVSCKLNMTAKKRSRNNYSWDFYMQERRVKTSELFDSLYSSEKFIPDCYKYNSLTVRTELLRGLFDTDGSATYDGTRLHVAYSTVSKRLACDVVELLNGMGMIATIHEDKRESHNVCYCINVNTSKDNKCSLFSLTRKLNVCLSAKESKHNYSRVAIRSVEKLPEKLEINCIYVDNKEHLYQCDNGIITHNTAYAIRDITKELMTRRPEEIAFVTFTRKGAEEGLKRVCSKLMLEPDDLPYFRTLHSLTFHALGLKASQMFGRIDQRKFNKMYGYNVNRVEVDTGKVSPTRDSMYLDYYDMERAGALTSKQIVEADIEISYYRQLVRNYEEYKSSQCLVDFFDCLIKYVQEGDSLPCKVIYCDECQDISALQWKVIEKAFAKAEKIVLLGDDKQSIYLYSGARPDFLIEFAKKFPVVPLSVSYRIPMSVYRLAKAIVNFIGDKTDTPFEPRPENGEGSITQLNSLDRLKHFIDTDSLHDDPNSTQWFILSRNNCFLEQPKKLLEENLIPYWTADGFFMGGEIMKRLKDYEGFKCEGYKDEAKREKFRRAFGIEDFSEPFTETNLFTEDRKWVYASYIEKYGLDTLQDMCRWNPQILISTIHHVKGGEAENVAVMLDATGRTKGNIFNNIDEELRILYVGITRTKKNLYLIDSKNGNGFDDIIQTVKEENDLDF